MVEEWFGNVGLRNPRSVKRLPDGRYWITIDIKDAGEDKYVEAVYVLDVNEKVPAAQWLASMLDTGDLGPISDFVITPEMHWQDVRRQRDVLLQQSDLDIAADKWDVMTIAQRLRWRQYRQQLRDITTSTTDPKAVVWPTPPT